MNYLAHLYLSDGTGESLLGNLAADFLKAPASSVQDPLVRQGVELHRRIDRFTDSHPVFSRSVERFSPPRRRAAPVLVDIFYDHFLARHWERYAPVPLPDFLEHTELRMNDRWDRLPAAVQERMERLRPISWMSNYAEIGGIAFAVDRLAKRVRPEVRLAGGAVELMNNYEGLSEDFTEFFDELVAFVEAQRGPRVW